MKKQTNSKLDKKLAGKISKELEAQYPGGFAHQAVLGAIKKQEEAKGKGQKKPNLKPMDADLVSAMEKRLVNLEGLSKAQRAEIKRKGDQLQELKSEVDKLKKEVPAERVEKYRTARVQNEAILKENNEIKAFMKEYGYNWDDKTGALNFEEVKENLEVKRPNYRNELPKEIDLGVIIKRIDALNAIAEVDAKKLIANKGVHSLGIHEPLNIYFYKNGIILDGYAFHPYHSREAQGMLSDILDGYFPYDLKTKYPEGVPLKVVDKTTEKYEVKASINKPTLPSTEKSGNKQVVIQQGTIEVDTAVKLMEKEGKKFDQSEIVTLRLRTENGKTYLIIKLLISDTMKAVYEYAKPYSEKEGTFVIRSTFPRQEYSAADSKTLKELGLAPSAALVMQ